MISGEKIGTYISNPLTIDKEELETLLVLTEKYPYCSSLQILYLKGLALTNDIHFENHLKTAAIHVPDRTRLYTLIHSGEEVSIEEEEVINEETTILPVQDEKEINHSNNETVSKVENNEKLVVDKDIIPTKKEESPKADIIAEEVSKSESVEIKKEEKQPKSDIASNLEGDKTKNTASKIKALQTKEEVIPFSNETDLEVDILVKAIDVVYVDSEVSTKEPIETAPELAEIESSDEDRIINTNIPIKEEKNSKELSFIEWLRLKQSTSQFTENNAESVEKAKQKKTALKEENNETKNLSSDTRKKEKRNFNREIDSLLDKFIAEEPTISRPVKDFYNASKNARESVEDTNNIVSETLAEIHVLQKNYSKAISAYHKLILLYPEKKLFFASRIEKIKEEIKKR